jgi:hypothetical protein
MNDAGMIAIQHQVLDNVGQGSPNFVDFIMTCLQDDDEDESTNRSGTQEKRSFHSPPSVADHPYSLGWDEGSKRSVSMQVTPAASIAAASKKVDDDDDEETDDDDDLPPISKVPLFGSIETTTTKAKAKAKASTSRKVRRRRRAARQEEESEDNDSDASQALLGEEVPLDVTARATTPPRRRRRIPLDEEDGSSSPELVYK